MQSLSFFLNDISRCVDAATYARGQDYERRGKVQDAVQLADRIDGEVSGSGGQRYHQTIRVTSGARGARIEGECSCPMDYNCKHVVAVLLHILAQHEHKPAPPGEPGALPDALSAWLSVAVDALATSALPVAAAVPAKPLLYQLVCVLIPAVQQRRVELLLCKARLRKDGAIASASLLSETYSLMAYPPSYVQTADHASVRLFVAMRDGHEWGKAVAEPRNELGWQLLQGLVDRGRLYWAEDRSELKTGTLRQLVPGPSRSVSPAWQAISDASSSIRLGWQCGDGTNIPHVLPTTPPMYVRNGEIGALSLETAAVPFAQIKALIEQAPIVTAEHVIPLARQLAARGLSHILPLPAGAAQTVRTGIAPQPCLRLGSVVLNSAASDFAIPGFVYDGQWAPADPTHLVCRATPNGSETIMRDDRAEADALATLSALGFHPSLANEPGRVTGALALDGPAAWLQFEREHARTLRESGWHIELMPTYRYQLTDISDWYADVKEESGNAWFDLELGVIVKRQRVPLLPILLQLIRSAPQDFAPGVLAAHHDDDELIARLPEGTVIALPWARVRPILGVLAELFFVERIGDAIRLPGPDAARLAELEARTQLRWFGDQRLRTLGRQMHAFEGIQAVATPAGLQASLRPYQSEGLAWMQFLREYGLAGILADDMGLGKTIQTLAHILTEKEAGRLDAPALVVAPTSLMGNWQAEAARFAPGLRVLLLHGKERLQRFDEIDHHDLVLTTYALLPRDEAVLRARRFHLLILDESQYIKNSRAKAAQTAALLNVQHRLCLTGTPLQNHLGELWSQFHFLMPGLLGSEQQFNAHFRKAIEKQGDNARNAFLLRRIKPFLLRRTKDAVAKELPPKTEIVREIELVGAQCDLYETVRLAMDKKIRAEIDKKGMARSQIVILDALLKLRQVCCDPRLVTVAPGRKSQAPSAKLNELLLMLDALLDEGRKVLIFSQFTSMLALIETELKARQIPYALLTGDTLDRTAQVDMFQGGTVPVFLISLKAGGIGLNLTAADTVIHFDPWWNPAAENQATDRAWRIGQDKPVFVYKLIAKGTLEERIQAMQRDKAALAEAILADGATQTRNWTRDDLQAIFSPIVY